MAESENLIGWFARFMMPVIAVTVGARLDVALERALLTKMRELSPAQRTNLFDGYGPLSSFAAKIDVAYALSIFDDAVYTDLTVIRKIRNVFAHPQRKVDQAPDHFDDDPEHCASGSRTATRRSNPASCLNERSHSASWP
jgi:hypothetical protein